jgi:hypothetical protein
VRTALIIALEVSTMASPLQAIQRRIVVGVPSAAHFR